MNSIVAVKRTKALVVAVLWLTVFISTQYAAHAQEELLLIGRAALTENPKDCVTALKYLFAYRYVTNELDDQLDEEIRGCEVELRRQVEQSRTIGASGTSNESWSGPRIIISTELYRSPLESEEVADWEDFVGTLNEDELRNLGNVIRPLLDTLQPGVLQPAPVRPGGR